MTNHEKQRVAEMRNRGMGYRDIASALNLTENCIKKYCQRNNLGGVRVPSVPDQVADVCPECGSALHNAKTGRHRRFCSDVCRLAWWHKHPEHLSNKEKYSYHCLCCGHAFQAYGNANRKYCSHTCYIRVRFGSKEGVASE